MNEQSKREALAQKIVDYLGRKWCGQCEVYCHECGCTPSKRWASAMELAALLTEDEGREQAAGEVERLREALEAIVSLDHIGTDDWVYDTGIDRGHENAQEIARKALSPTPSGEEVG